MLNFEEIEDCFPEHGALCAADGRITVSAQWLHDFAYKVAEKERKACAKVCEARVPPDARHGTTDVEDESRACADAIRLRSNV